MNRPMSVGVRIPAGIEAAAAGNTDRRLTERVLKQNSFLGQRVVIRRRQLSIAQTAQAVCPQLVRNKKQTIFLFFHSILSYAGMRGQSKSSPREAITFFSQV